MNVESEDRVVLSRSAMFSLGTIGKPSSFPRLTTEESIAIRKSHMVGGSRTAPLGKQEPKTFPRPAPPPIINEQKFDNFLAEMRQGMIGVWGAVNELSKEIQEIRSQNLSRSASVDNLGDTSSNLRIGSTIKLSEPGSQTVEVMSVTMDQPMDQTTDPGPSSSPNDTIELGCSNDDLLAADSDDETQATQDDHHLLSESEEEDKVSPEEPLSTRWADDE
jgi:hypothetical protein